MKKDKSTLMVVIAVAIAAIASAFGCESHMIASFRASAWLMPLIGGLTSVMGGLVGGIMGNKQAAKAEKERAKATQALTAWRDKVVNENVLDRADTLSMLKIYREQMDEQGRKFQNNAIKGGASEEAKVAYAQQANKGYADAVSKISAQAQSRKDMAEQEYMRGMVDIYNKAADSYMQAGQQTSNAASSAFGGLGSALSGIEWGKK